MNTEIFTKRAMLNYMRDFSDNSLEQIPRNAWSFIKSKLLDTKCLFAEVDFKNNQITFLDMRGFAICSCYDDVAPFLNYIKMKYDSNTTISDCATSAVANVSDICMCAADLSNKVDYYNTNTTGVVSNSHSHSIDYSYLNTSSNEDKKENKKMNGINFDFGKVTSDAVRLSLYGVAVKSVSGNYVSYDPKSHSIMDVEIVNMPVNGMLYKIPVAIKDIKAGDVIIHNKVPMFVVEVHESTVKVVDIREGAEKEIYPTKNIFGFNFMTKIISLLDLSNSGANADNPFGNMLPFLMMNENGKDFDPMMFMLMNDGKFDTSNPMLMYFMMKDGDKSSDMLPFMFMMMNNNNKSNG